MMTLCIRNLLPLTNLAGHGYFTYRVSGRISGQSNPVYGQITDVKEAGLSSQISGRPDILCFLLVM
jgi:hypothetical protein